MRGLVHPLLKHWDGASYPGIITGVVPIWDQII